MYADHFNLTRNPFDQLPDPDFLFLTEQHEEALARLRVGLAINDSFTIVTGEVGSGKTTLVRRFLSDIAEECTPAFVTHTRLSDIELLQMIMLELGVKPYKMGKVQMLTELRRIVESEHENDRRVVVVIDEAQNFSAPLLEELRLLTCMDTEKTKSINIILVGQPQLSCTLESPDLDQLRQRCRLRCHLDALSESETVEYIRHRINVADGDADEMFDENVLSSIYGLTGGIPRLVNTLCDTALILACIAKRDRVTVESLNDALREFHWTESVDLRGTLENNHLGAGTAAHLTITQNGAPCGEHHLNLPTYIIGRSEECSIVLHDKFLSRHHALLAHKFSGWTISDLSSTNGMTVNSRRVREAKLSSGDVIEVGTYLMRLTLEYEQPSVSAMGDKTGLYAEMPDLAVS